MYSIKIFVTLTFLIILMSILAPVQCQIDVKDDIPPYKDPSTPIEDRVQDLLDRMTLEEKVAQMSLYLDAKFGLIELIGDIVPLFAIYNYNKRLDIPPIRPIDSPHGAHFYGTAFPVSIARGSTWDPSLEYKINEAIAKEAEAIGANVVFAPTINIIRHPGWGRSQESFGEDTYHMTKMAVAAVKGLQTNVMAQVKHYAAYSIEDNRFNINVLVDERTLREIYLPPFKETVLKGNAASIMSSYNKINSQYAGENEYLLNEILKCEWGFDGFVASDWVMGCYSTVNSSLAGLDMEMPFPKYYGDKLVEAVKNGEVPESVINESVSRILRKKFSFGLFEKNPKFIPGVMRSEDHKKLALKASEEGIVLLKNKNDILPLNISNVKRIAVIGKYANIPRMGDRGSSRMLSIGAVTPLQGIKNKAGDVKILSCPGFLKIIAQSYAKMADAVIIVAALTPRDEGESKEPTRSFSGDRHSLGLSKKDVELIKAVSKVNDKVIVVIEAGGAITMNGWIDDIEAVIMAWYPGIEGGNALANIIFGYANPSGKLTITFPKGLDQLYTFGSGQSEVNYTYYHGYRYFDKRELEPLFPFGFGLSYTTFNYSNLSLNQTKIGINDTLCISFNLTNTGKIAGEEIIQIYIGYESSSVDRAIWDLKGFEKIYLEAGECKKVIKNIPANDLAYYDVESKEWIVEPITYNISIGSSSRDLFLQDEFEVIRGS